MKKYILFLTAVIGFNTLCIAQTTRKLKKVMELKMPKTVEDDMPGTRGASVAWHPVQKKYYVSFAGNKDYPMAVFNMIGKRLSPDEQTTLIDTRGLWYNTAAKKICGNGYADNGWFSYKLNALGLPNSMDVDTTGQNQPNEQSVGAFNPLKKQVLFIEGSQIWAYNDKAIADENKTAIHWGLTPKDGIAADEDVTLAPEGYNTSTLIYSGIPNAEAGVLNIVNKQVELYSLKTGFLTQKLALPDDAVVEATFNFAFANGIYWFFNMEQRVWIGYK